jgi:TPR repeat protein
MSHRPRFAFLVLLSAGFAGAPAHADFYKLDGRFQCLERANAVCFDATPSRQLPVAKQAPAESPTRVAPPPVVALPEQAPQPAPAPLDPILTISARIKAKQPAPGDLDTLRHNVEAGDKRALELLAWCAFEGIGTNRDPLTAYRLYGAAAADQVPHARDNQRLIYEHDLSPDQRQQLLMLEASGGKSALP